MSETIYINCQYGCGHRTAVTASGTGNRLPAVCPNCGEPGVVLLEPFQAKTTPGYDTSGNPVAGKGAPFEGPASLVARRGASFKHWRKGGV